MWRAVSGDRRIHRFLPTARLAHYEPFLRDYTAVRLAEGGGPRLVFPAASRNRRPVDRSNGNGPSRRTWGTVDRVLPAWGDNLVVIDVGPASLVVFEPHTPELGHFRMPSPDCRRRRRRLGRRDDHGTAPAPRRRIRPRWMRFRSPTRRPTSWCSTPAFTTRPTTCGRSVRRYVFRGQADVS